MKRCYFTVEQIINMLWEAEVRLSWALRVTFILHSSLNYRPPAREAITTTKPWCHSRYLAFRFSVDMEFGGYTMVNGAAF